jgi:hypothetical protein
MSPLSFVNVLKGGLVADSVIGDQPLTAAQMNRNMLVAAIEF